MFHLNSHKTLDTEYFKPVIDASYVVDFACLFSFLFLLGNTGY